MTSQPYDELTGTLDQDIDCTLTGQLKVRYMIDNDYFEDMWIEEEIVESVRYIL